MSDVNTSNQVAIPNWFIIVSAFALLWNVMGIMAFYAQVNMTPEMLAKMPVIEQELLKSVPMWVDIAFGVATIGGTLGCLLLILKKALAQQVLILSALGVVTQMYYSFAMSNSLEVYGKEAAAMPAMIMLVAAALIWLATSSKKKGWLS